MDEKRYTDQVKENARRARAGQATRRANQEQEFDWDKALKLFKRTLKRVYRY